MPKVLSNTPTAALALLILSMCCATTVWAQENQNKNESVEPARTPEGRPLKTSTLPFRGYGKYSSNLKKMCDAINDDGRVAFLNETAKSMSDRDVTCEACRPLMQAIVQSCKLSITKTDKKKPVKSSTSTPSSDPAAEAAPNAIDATPTPEAKLVAPQREPSPVVIDRAVSLFSAIAEDKAIADSTYPALQRLFFGLTDKNRATVAGKEYFESLRAFVMPLFKDSMLSEEAKAKASAVNPEVHEKKLNSLFDQ